MHTSGLIAIKMTADDRWPWPTTEIVAVRAEIRTCEWCYAGCYQVITDNSAVGLLRPNKIIVAFPVSLPTL